MKRGMKSDSFTFLHSLCVRGSKYIRSRNITLDLHNPETPVPVGYANYRKETVRAVKAERESVRIRLLLLLSLNPTRPAARNLRFVVDVRSITDTD